MTDPRHDDHGGAASNPSAAVTGVDRRTLDAIFRHPLAHNLSWREVVNLFTAIGGSEEKHNGEFVFRAGDDTLAMNKPHTKDLTGQEVMDLRHFLKRAGWSPSESAPPELDAAATAPSLIVVIDHAGAKVYRIDRSIDDGHGVTAYDPKHLLHHLERKMRDEDRDETYPEDEQFFEQVADLQAHHKQTYARIVREIVADLPHLTTPELLELGRHAFAQA
jgi:hypothetical protein